MTFDRKLWLMRFALAAAVAVAFYNAVGAAFVLDDLVGIALNPTIRKLWPPAFTFPESMRTSTVAGRPLANYTFAIDYALGGGDPRVSHLGNVMVHLACALTLFALLRRTFASASVAGTHRRAADWLAFFSSLLWAVHPLTTQAVTYAVQRAESLMALFFLLTLYLLARSEGGRRPVLWLSASAACCIVGAGAKEVIAVAPLAALLYDRAFMAGSFGAALKKRGWYYGSLTLTWAAVGILLYSTGMHGGTVGGAVPMSRLDYLAVQGWAVSRYLKLALLPYGLTFDYGEMTWLVGEPVVYLFTALTAALLAAAGWLARRKPATGFPALLFFLILAPTSSFVPILDPVAEHRMYLPLAAAVALAVALAWSWFSRLGARAALTGGAVLAVAAVALAAATHARNEVYGSELSLWRDAFEKSPKNSRAAMGIAKALGEAGDAAGALTWYRKAVEVNPGKDVNRYNLGSALLAAGDAVGAAAEFARAVEIDPEYFEARFNLGLALMQAGSPASAVPHFERLMAVSPHDPKMEFNLGKALAASGRYAEGIAHMAEALKKGGYPPPGALALADALAAAGRRAEALNWYSYALDSAMKAGEWNAAEKIKAKLGALERSR